MLLSLAQRKPGALYLCWCLMTCATGVPSTGTGLKISLACSTHNEKEQTQQQQHPWMAMPWFGERRLPQLVSPGGQDTAWGASSADSSEQEADSGHTNPSRTQQKATLMPGCELQNPSRTLLQSTLSQAASVNLVSSSVEAPTLSQAVSVNLVANSVCQPHHKQSTLSQAATKHPPCHRLP